MAEAMKKLYTENIDRVDQPIHNLEEELNDLNGLEQNVNRKIPEVELRGLRKTVDLKLPETIYYTVKKWDTLSGIVKNEIFKYYSKLSETDKESRKLINKISAEIKKQNNMDTDALKEWQKLTIKIANITKIVNEHLNSTWGESKEITNENLPDKIVYEVIKWDTLSNIIKNKVLTYYPNLLSSDKEKWALISPISKEIETQNNVKADALKEWQTLTIKTANITKIVNDYLKGNNWANNNTVNNKESNNWWKIENVSWTINYKVKQWDNFIKIITTEIFNKYYNKKLSSDDKRNQDLLNSIIKEIKIQNNMSSDKLNIWQELKIPMAKIKPIIDKYIKDNGVKIETIKNQNYVVLEKYEDLKKNHPLLKKIDGDHTEPGRIMKDRIRETLKKSGKIIIPDYLETKDTKPITGWIDAITKPDKIIKDPNTKKPALEWKTFVIDPWHGFDDPWALWLVKCNNIDNAHTIIYESWIAMDMSYRVAKLLRAHWATVKFTHYIPTRWISNKSDLPPCLPEQGKYQDVRNWSKGKLWVDSNNSKKSRCIQSNKCSWMFISLHADATSKKEKVNWKEVTKLLPDRKKVSTKYRGEWRWKEFADYLMTNKGWIPAQEWYQQTSDKQELYVLGETNKNPGVLIELFNLNNYEQWNQYRNPAIRQTKAKEIVDATVNYYISKQ